MCILKHIKTILYHHYTYYIILNFLLIFLLYQMQTITFSIISLLYLFFSIISDYIRLSHPNFQPGRWQTPGLVLCAERWMISSVQECQQCFGMTRRARFMKPSQHIQQNEDYYEPYFLYYTYYFESLSRI